MSRVEIEDVAGGDKITYHRLSGHRGNFHLFVFNLDPNSHQQLIDALPSLTCRPNDVFLVGYPKCGTHWLWEMLTMMYRGSVEVTSVNKVEAMIERVPANMLDKLPSPRILNSHLYTQDMPQEAFRKKNKFVFVYRNPKDVAVSYYHHTVGVARYNYDGQFHNYLKFFMSDQAEDGTYPDYLLHWQTFIKENPDFSIHLVSYEAIHKNTIEELQRLRDFLQLDITDDFLHQISETCEIDKLRKEKDANLNPKMKALLKATLKGDFSLLRKGKVGGWRQWFNEKTSAEFDRWWADKTKLLDPKLFTFTYDP